jgi:single-strand DNA-binding protein
MNHIVLIGRLTRDPELRYTPNGVAVCNFDLAVDRPTTNQAGERETDFIRIIVWQKQAESAAKYLSKGRLVAVEGRLQIRNYEAQDGQKRRVAEVVAREVKYLERAKDDGQGQGQQQGQGQRAGSGSQGSGDDLDGINLDDLPF